MGHGYGHLQVLDTGGGYNEGDVYQSHYFVKYKAVFMTRMTGMTRNMKTSSDSETANKVSEKLSFLSLLSWEVCVGGGGGGYKFNNLKGYTFLLR